MATEFRYPVAGDTLIRTDREGHFTVPAARESLQPNSTRHCTPDPSIAPEWITAEVMIVKRGGLTSTGETRN